MKKKLVLFSTVLATLVLFSFVVVPAFASAPIFAVPPVANGNTAQDIDYGPNAALLPSNGEIFNWIKDFWQFGRDGEYGWRMPSTEADYAAAEYIYQKFQ